ncbi:MAG: dicarboxylate/amino acid:cation symporter [Melioribacteraceae bacterium]|nr:dicarboxylate/amino acid:cation symporter [Melioribacteraceae bacterium]
MLKLQLHWQILIGFFVAILVGLYLTEYVEYVTWMGDLFLRALNMVIVPLILSSIVSGVANIGSGESLGRLGAKTLGYYLTTSTFAIIVGLLFVNLLQPGVGADLGLSKEVEELAVVKKSFGDTLLEIVPTNIFESFMNSDMLQIIFFSIIFGFFITKIEDRYSTHLTDLFNATFEVMMKITMVVIKFAPLGILGIVAGIVAEQAGDPGALIDMVGRLGLYMAAVFFALVVHATVTLPLILKFVAKVNPWLHLKAMTTPLLTAFSTSSSNATLPLTMKAVENDVGVSNKITSFTLPLGATVNMDGTALYECVAAMFIAQAYGVDLGLLEQAIVVFTALLASIGAAGIPMAGLVTITIILSAVGLPLEGVGLILSVDRILDMCRTTVNVWSDSCGAALIAKTEGESLNVDTGV